MILPDESEHLLFEKLYSKGKTDKYRVIQKEGRKYAMTKVIDEQDCKDSDYVALNPDGEIVSCHSNPEIAKAEAIIKGVYSPFIIPGSHLKRDKGIYEN